MAQKAGWRAAARSTRASAGCAAGSTVLAQVGTRRWLTGTVTMSWISARPTSAARQPMASTRNWVNGTNAVLANPATNVVSAMACGARAPNE
jgi:hypothetical protein